MTKKTIAIFLLMMGLLLTAFFVYSKSLWVPSKKSTPVYEISVICRGHDLDSSPSIKAGIDQAADDLNAEVNYITLSKDNDAGQQVSTLKREVGSGANAVLIFPVDSEKMVQPIHQAAHQVPVVILQPDGSRLSDLPSVSCNEFQLGAALAQKIIKDGTTQQGADLLFLHQADQQHQQLSKGMASVFKKMTGHISDFTLSDNESKAGEEAKNFLLGKKYQAIAALDAQSLEIAGETKHNLLQSGANVPTKVYGVGRTDLIPSLLEENAVQAVGIENEYSIGYLGVKMAVDGIQKKTTEGMNVSFVISDHSNMYEPKNESVLFPFFNH